MDNCEQFLNLSDCNHASYINLNLRKNIGKNRFINKSHFTVLKFLQLYEYINKFYHFL